MGILAIELRRRAVVAGMVALISGVTSVGCKTTNNPGKAAFPRKAIVMRPSPSS